MVNQTLPFSTLISIDRSSTIPIFKQVVNALIELIKTEKLRSGHQLPATRDMAQMLKLNRTTIVAVYEELQLQGWLDVIRRKGYFIARQLPLTTPLPFDAPLEDKHLPANGPSPYKTIAVRQQLARSLKPYQLMINDGYPDARIAPLNLLIDRYKFLAGKTNLHNKLLADGPMGSVLLRTELADFLSKTRALNITPEQILITHGAQFALTIAANMLLHPGSTVIVGDLNYPLADRLFEQLGAKLIKVKMDENGIDVDAIENICKQSVPTLLYIVPHHHHPTTVTLSAARREKLLRIIRRYHLPVIEDDYDYDYHYENAPILPLASADHQNYILYIGSISKTLSPTVRLGYLIGGEDFIWQSSKLKQILDIRGDVLFEESVGHLFQTGEMQRHLRKSARLYKSRRDVFCNILNSSIGTFADFTVPKGGMAVWTLFETDYSIPQLAERLSTHGIYLNDGSIHRYNNNSNGLRLGFASLNLEEMQSFAEALGKST